jgi:7,8-dihydropterin-6-yl-methyl-4-(beta-D-ribofuranosyl)aminobenzene 5'-phosphate synthase
MIQVQCIVDNSATRSSRFWAEHGISFHIETPDGRVLFDTGQSGQVLLHNAGQLGIDLGQIDALALSHGHYDHTGGLNHILTRCRSGLPLYAHPDLFRERYVLRGGEYESIGMEISRADLEQHVALRLSADPVEILPGVWTTGEITDRPEFEGRSETHRIRVDGQWQPDPYRDDFSLVLEAGDGVVVLCGCCHAGLLNTLKHVKQIFGQGIRAVAGGTHLVSATDEMLHRTIATLRTTYGAPRLYPGHCTGERAYVALAQAFGERVQPCPAGTILAF